MTTKKTKTGSRKPRGFTWAKFFSKPPEKEKVRYDDTAWRLSWHYRYGPLAECHPQMVQTRGRFAATGRVSDDCPEELQELDIRFSSALRHEGWSAARQVYVAIRDFKVKGAAREKKS